MQSTHDRVVSRCKPMATEVGSIPRKLNNYLRKPIASFHLVSSIQRATIPPITRRLTHPSIIHDDSSDTSEEGHAVQGSNPLTPCFSLMQQFVYPSPYISPGLHVSLSSIVTSCPYLSTPIAITASSAFFRRRWGFVYVAWLGIS